MKPNNVCCRNKVILNNRKAVVGQLSGSRHAVVRQSSSSCQAGNRQAIIKQSLDCCYVGSPFVQNNFRQTK